MNADLIPFVSPVIISSAVAVVGWLLKGIALKLIDAIWKLIVQLTDTMKELEVLKGNLKEILIAVGDVQKMKDDQNILFARLRKLQLDLDDTKAKLANGHP